MFQPGTQTGRNTDLPPKEEDQRGDAGSYWNMDREAELH
jgi:hypothetical protein